MNHRISGFGGLMLLLSAVLMGCTSFVAQLPAPGPQTFHINSMTTLKQALSGGEFDSGVAVLPGDVLLLDGGDFDLGGESLNVNVDGLTLIGNGSTLTGSDTLLTINASNLTVEGLRLVDAAVGIRVEQTSRVIIRDNIIRGNRVGIQVSSGSRVRDIEISNNDISRNRSYGLLAPFNLQTIRAHDNWWGSSTGPESDDNPNGRGDRIRGRVESASFLLEPINSTIQLQLVDVTIPEFIFVGQPVTLSATLQNTSFDEGFANISLEVIGDNFTDRRRFSQPVLGETSLPLFYEVTFPRAGEFTITFRANDVSVSETVIVAPPF